MKQEDFAGILASEHFKEVVTVTREPNGSLDAHTHAFEAKALILDGELRIRIGDDERLYRTGDVFHLRANESHSERYGPNGVTYLVGRK